MFGEKKQDKPVIIPAAPVPEVSLTSPTPQQTLTPNPSASPTSRTTNSASAPPTSSAADADADADAETANKKLTKQQFRELVKQTMKDLPRPEDLQGLSDEDVHNTPPIVLEKSEGLVKIVEAVEKDPSFEPDAMAFYRKCALDQKILNIVKARCLSHLRSLSRKRDQALNPRDFSPEVVRLSNFIPE